MPIGLSHLRSVFVRPRQDDGAVCTIPLPTHILPVPAWAKFAPLRDLCAAGEVGALLHTLIRMPSYTHATLVGGLLPTPTGHRYAEGRALDHLADAAHGAEALGAALWEAHHPEPDAPLIGMLSFSRGLLFCDTTTLFATHRNTLRVVTPPAHLPHAPTWGQPRLYLPPPPSAHAHLTAFQEAAEALAALFPTATDDHPRRPRTRPLAFAPTPCA